VLCGWLVLGEHLGGGELAGGVLIVAAGWLVVRSSRLTTAQLEVVGVAG
jgi:drug/metabolite transporter (DMT)-like permease